VLQRISKGGQAAQLAVLVALAFLAVLLLA
jgi:hypothetical protein